MKSTLEETTNEEQCGFREDKSTIDAIFVLRQLIEKRQEYDKNMVIAFIDIKKAYDMVQRDIICISLIKRDIKEG